MITGKKIGLWILQIIPAFILLNAAYLKFTSNPAVVEIFTQLGMEPSGRIVIGVLELLAGLMLLTPFAAAVGGVLGLSVMVGAFIAHASTIGMVGPNLGPVTTVVIVMISCALVVYIRRKQLPFFGDTM